MVIRRCISREEKLIDYLGFTSPLNLTPTNSQRLFNCTLLMRTSTPSQDITSSIQLVHGHVCTIRTVCFDSCRCGSARKSSSASLRLCVCMFICVCLKLQKAIPFALPYLSVQHCFITSREVDSHFAIPQKREMSC